MQGNQYVILLASRPSKTKNVQSLLGTREHKPWRLF